MVAEKPEIPTTGRYSVKETCRILGIHRNTLLEYTKRGLITAGVRRATFRKFYTGSEILKLWTAQV
jgi:DNA-binding transcriptional MerR regulator